MKHGRIQNSRRIGHSRGMTLVEIIIYLFILVLLVGVVGSTLFTLTSSYRSMKAAYSVETGASTALERMVREIRFATAVDASSVLGSSPGVLVLNHTDSSGNASSVKFSVNSQSLHVFEGSTDTGTLTPSTARVTNLVFNKITTTKSVAVRITVTIESGNSTNYQSKTFYATAVLRGSYRGQ